MRPNRNIEDIGHDNFSVAIRRNESTEDLIKRFIRRTKKEKIFEEVFDRRHYKKPTTVKREEKFKRELVIKRLREKEQMDIAINDL